jgi:hypothetical protein
MMWRGLSGSVDYWKKGPQNPLAPRPLSPKGARGETKRIYALAPLGERAARSAG